MAQPLTVFAGRFVQLPSELRISIVDMITPSERTIGLGDFDAATVYEHIVDRFTGQPTFLNAFARAWFSKRTYHTVFEAFQGYGGYHNPEMTRAFTGIFRDHGEKLHIDLSFPFRKKPTYENICDVVLATEAFIKACASLKYVQSTFIDSHRASRNGIVRYCHQQDVVDEVFTQLIDIAGRLQGDPLVVACVNYRPEGTRMEERYASK